MWRIRLNEVPLAGGQLIFTLFFAFFYSILTDFDVQFTFQLLPDTRYLKSMCYIPMRSKLYILIDTLKIYLILTINN